MTSHTFDRRREARRRIPLRVHLKIPASGDQVRDETVEFGINDVSEGGFSFSAQVLLSLSKKYDVDIEAKGNILFSASVRLIWARQEERGYSYGAYFSQILPSCFEVLDQLCEDHESAAQHVISDRRQSNRRNSGVAPWALQLDHRKVERRSAIRLKQREAVSARFVTEALQQLIYRRVVITGIGAVSPLGIGKVEILKSLRSGTTGVRRITRFDPSAFPCQIAGEVKDFAPQKYMNIKKAHRMDLATQFGLISAILASQDAGLSTQNGNRRRMGVAMGTTMGGLGWAFDQDDTFEKRGYLKMHPYTIAAASPNACSGEISAEFGAQGPCVTFSQGCSSAAAAISYAYDQVRVGRADIMFAGGCEAPLIASIFGAFCQSGIMAKAQTANEHWPRPFAKSRDGIVLAEGGAVLILEDLEHALARKATIYAEIAGVSSTCDGQDMVMPRTDGAEAARAISLCLERAHINREDVGAVFAHAPGSREGDAVEMKALKHVFNHGLSEVPVACVKSMMGYAQGATTAIECVAACLSLAHGFVPPVINTDSSEISLNLAKGHVEKKLRSVLVNCFGFGGKNICLLLKKIDE